MVMKSGSSPYLPVYPPGPAQIVWVSSITRYVPCFPVSSRSASWNPASGRTIPMFVSAGSVSTAATSPWASSRSSPSTSFHSVTLVVTTGSTGGPRFSGRDLGRPSSSTTKLSSTVPW